MTIMAYTTVVLLWTALVLRWLEQDAIDGSRLQERLDNLAAIVTMTAAGLTILGTMFLMVAIATGK